MLFPKIVPVWAPEQPPETEQVAAAIQAQIAAGSRVLEWSCYLKPETVQALEKEEYSVSRPLRCMVDVIAW